MRRAKSVRSAGIAPTGTDRQHSIQIRSSQHRSSSSARTQVSDVRIRSISSSGFQPLALVSAVYGGGGNSLATTDNLGETAGLVNALIPHRPRAGAWCGSALKADNREKIGWEGAGVTQAHAACYHSKRAWDLSLRFICQVPVQGREPKAGAHLNHGRLIDHWQVITLVRLWFGDRQLSTQPS